MCAIVSEGPFMYGITAVVTVEDLGLLSYLSGVCVAFHDVCSIVVLKMLFKYLVF